MNNETLSGSLRLFGVAVAVFAGAANAEEATSVSASFYAQSGLVLHYDGIENAGAGQHDASATKWVNLGGAADGTYDVTLPSWVTVGETSMYSGVIPNLKSGSAINSSKSSAPSFASVEGHSATTPVTTLEVVMARDRAWTYQDNYYNTQVPFSIPQGSLSYRSNGQAWTNDFNINYPVSDTQTDLMYWQPANVAAWDGHTLAAKLGVGVNARWFDGASGGTGWDGNYKSNKSAIYKFFSNTRVGIRIYAIRLYNRALSPDEIALHAKLDKVRFFGASRDILPALAVKEVSVPVLDGAEDSCPDPEVWDMASGQRLTRGVDYRISYFENDRPGTAAMVVDGLGAYAASSVRKTFQVVHGFTAAVSDSGKGPLGATVNFPAADSSRALYVAWGETDGGPLTNGWPKANFAKVADVEAGATSAVVTLPEAATGFAALRFFLEHEATPRTYVTDGLRAQYDGEYNAGTFDAPIHDNSSTNWLDLSGHGNTLWLPDYVTVQEKSLLSAVRTNPATGQKTTDKAGTYPQPVEMNGLVATPAELTVEDVMRRANAWTFTDNYDNLQNVATTPLGYICYRKSSTTGIGVGYLDWRSSTSTYTATYNSWFSPVDVRQVHTLGARLAKNLSNCSFLTDGVVGTGVTEQGRYQDAQSGFTCYRFFSNLRTDITVHAIRIYARRLSDLEMKRNALVDAARFRGGNGTILAASALVRGGRLSSDPKASDFTVRFAAAPCARQLCVAWGKADGGTGTNGWANLVSLCTVPAGATEAASVALPAAALRSRFARFLLIDVYDSTSYVTNGLAGHWDGIDNVLEGGVRKHDAATRTWHDLTGGGADVALPDYVSVESTSLYSTLHVGQTYPTVSVPGVSSTSTALTLECVARHCGWQDWTDLGNLQSICQTPLGTIGYRGTAANQMFCYLPIRGNRISLYDYRPDGQEVGLLNTMAISLTLDGSVPWVNAVRSDKLTYGAYTPERSDACSFFVSPRIALRVCGVRIYTRLLSKEELAWNSAVDDVRYRGAQAPMRASDLIDFRGDGTVILIK